MYGKIKRTISSGAAGRKSRQFPSANLSKSRWIHPPEALIDGTVEYFLKMYGRCDVSKPTGSDVIRDACHKIKFSLDVNKGQTGHSGCRIQKVAIQINIDHVTVIDRESRKIEAKHMLHHISFCADDKQNNNLFSYIANKIENKDSSKHECFVFISDKLAEQITLTIGQAFDLAREKFTKENPNFDDRNVLHRHVTKLEGENKVLKSENQTLKEENRILRERLKRHECSEYRPIIPNTPIPPAPNRLNPNLSLSTLSTNLGSLVNESGGHINGIADMGLTANLNQVAASSKGRNEIFDNDFNPRSKEPHSSSQVKSGTHTKAEDFGVLLKRIDNMSVLLSELDAFKRGMQYGDTGDSEQVLTSTNEQDDQKSDANVDASDTYDFPSSRKTNS